MVNVKWFFEGKWATIQDQDFRRDRMVTYFRLPLPGLYPRYERIEGKEGNTAREFFWIPVWQIILFLAAAPLEKASQNGNILGFVICSLVAGYIVLGFRKCGITFNSIGERFKTLRFIFFVERWFVWVSILHGIRALSVAS